MNINLPLMKELMRSNEEELKIFLLEILKNFKYNKIISNEEYIIARGEGEVCLLAHMDTVFSQPPKFFVHDAEQKILYSPQGMGADDRAGIYCILEILNRGFHPSIIFTTGEESGGIGASALIKKYPSKNKILPNTKFLIQLDRRGINDCVFYNCANQDFIEWVESYGFSTAEGSYTDISIIAPEWEIAAVNLSVGYCNEHSISEMLFYDYTLMTIKKVIAILKDSSEGRGPINTKYIPKENNSNNNDICKICFTNKLGKNKIDISKYGLGIRYICKQCYKNFFYE